MQTCESSVQNFQSLRNIIAQSSFDTYTYTDHLSAGNHTWQKNTYTFFSNILSKTKEGIKLLNRNSVKNDFHINVSHKHSEKQFKNTALKTAYHFLVYQYKHAAHREKHSFSGYHSSDYFAVSQNKIF